jgi:hypothetical protein
MNLQENHTRLVLITHNYDSHHDITEILLKVELKSNFKFENQLEKLNLVNVLSWYIYNKYL